MKCPIEHITYSRTTYSVHTHCAHRLERRRQRAGKCLCLHWQPPRRAFGVRFRHQVGRGATPPKIITPPLSTMSLLSLSQSTGTPTILYSVHPRVSSYNSYMPHNHMPLQRVLLRSSVTSHSFRALHIDNLCIDPNRNAAQTQRRASHSAAVQGARNGRDAR